jgi:hypothetical protein
MFTAAERDVVRERLLDLARSGPGLHRCGDHRVAGAAAAALAAELERTDHALALRLSPLPGQLADGTAS